MVGVGHWGVVEVARQDDALALEAVDVVRHRFGLYGTFAGRCHKFAEGAPLGAGFDVGAGLCHHVLVGL